MKHTHLYLKLALGVLFSFFISCSSDNSSDSGETGSTGDSETEVIPLPQINSLSSSFLITGEELSISGVNFISLGNQTKLLVNGTAINITPASNSVINLELIPSIGIEELEIAIQIEDKISNSVDVFVVPNGWYKINNVDSNLDIIKTFSFDDTEDLVSLIDVIPADNSYNGSIFNMSVSATGYSLTGVGISDALLDLEMYNRNTGVTTGSSFVYFTEDAFVNNNTSDQIQIGLSNTRISHVDENSATVMNTLGKHVHTDDKGLSFTVEESPSYLSTETSGGYAADGVVYPAGKASDGYFYEIGFHFDRNPTDNYRNFIQKSESYNNWTIVDSITPYNFALTNAKFINPNYMLSVNDSNQLIESVDLAQTWSPIKEGVDEFYLRSETEWYAVSGESVISTTDSGATWNLEFDLPAGSVVNHIQFSSSKVVVSGNDGLLYVKHE